MAIPNQYQTLAQQIYGRPLEDWEYQNLAGKDVNEVQNILQQSMADYQAAQQQTVPGPGPAPTTQADRDGFYVNSNDTFMQTRMGGSIVPPEFGPEKPVPPDVMKDILEKMADRYDPMSNEKFSDQWQRLGITDPLKNQNLQNIAQGVYNSQLLKERYDAGRRGLDLYEPGYEKRFGSTPPGAFVTGGRSYWERTPEELKAEYEKNVQDTALSGANLLQDLVNYQPTGKSSFGDLYTRAQSDPSLLRKFHNESDEDALLRLKSNIKDAEDRQARREDLRTQIDSKIQAGGAPFIQSGQPYGTPGVDPYNGVGLMGALENMRRIQAQNPQFQGIGSIVSALTGAKEPLAFGQQTESKRPVEFITQEQATPKAPVGESRTEQQKAPTGTLRERATAFGDTFKSLTSDPTKTEYDVKKYLDTIRQDKDLMKAYGNKLDSYFAYYDKVPEYKGDTTDYLTKQLQNQQGAGTAQYWKSGLDTNTATKYMADTMRKYGLKDINQLGVKEIDVPESKELMHTGGDSGGDYYEAITPAHKKRIFYNKATGEEISGPDMDANTGQFGKTYAGKGNTAFRVQFNKETGKPVFYTTQHSSSDVGKIAPLLAMASFVPGLAPFAQGINALIAAKQGNPLGAVLSGLGAAGGIGKLMGASSDVLSGIKTARDVASVANALKNKDIFGLVSSGANLGGFDLGGMKIAGNITAKDAFSGLAAAKALQNKDYASLLNIAGQMSKSDNLQTAAKGLAMANAIKSKNPTKIAQVLASMAGGKKDDTPPPKGAGGGLLQGPGFVTVPDNAAVDPRVFSGIAGPLLARSM
jgi:hypothetical protein